MDTQKLIGPQSRIRLIDLGLREQVNTDTGFGRGEDSPAPFSAEGHTRLEALSTPATPEALAYLRLLTGDSSSEFRADQWAIIDGLVNRREKVLLIQRTGWGKSAVYFISAKLLRDQGRGPTLIISPLVSLMRNQVMAGRCMGLWIGALHSGTKANLLDFQNFVLPKKLDVLLTTPEQFANTRFLSELLPHIAQDLGLLVVDEAHCISDWGHDFRPDYQRISNIVGQLPGNSSLLATTATANHRAILDIMSQLSDIRVLRGPLLRENLALQSLGRMSVADRLAWLASALPTIERQGIIYTLTTSDADTVTLWLNFRGISAASFHSQLTLELRSELEDRFEASDVRILVATSALGLGYDNPNVGFVIHYQSHGSMIAYYQQVGRAGRNHNTALGILMTGDEDERINRSFRMSSLPLENEISQILNRLDELDQTSLRQLSSMLNISPKRIESVLRFLAVQTPATVVKAGGFWQRNPVPFPEGYADLRLRLIALREKEWREIQAYRRSEHDCRMSMLLRTLDDPEE